MFSVSIDYTTFDEQHFHCYPVVHLCLDNALAGSSRSFISLPVQSVFLALLCCLLHITWNCSNQSLIYHQNDPQSFYLCLMLFLKLSHKSSRIKRQRRRFSLSPPCISSLPVCRRSCRDARSALPLDDPLRYIWCQCEQLVFPFSLRFPHLLPLTIMLLICSLVCRRVIARRFERPEEPDWWPPGSVSVTYRSEKKHRKCSSLPPSIIPGP